MNLTSCTCGVVLDKDKLDFPCDIYNEEGNLDYELATWDGSDWVVYCKCPVCGAKILEK